MGCRKESLCCFIFSSSFFDLKTFLSFWLRVFFKKGMTLLDLKNKEEEEKKKRGKKVF